MSSCTGGSGLCSGHRACCTAGSLSAGTPLFRTSCWCWWRRPTPPSPSLGARGAGGAAGHHTRQEEVGGALAAPQQRLLASLAGGRQAREGAPVSVCSTCVKRASEGSLWLPRTKPPHGGPVAVCSILCEGPASCTRRGVSLVSPWPATWSCGRRCAG